MLEWQELPRIFPDMPIWGAIELPWQYVMTYDEPEFAVSAKRFPGTGNRIDLGTYLTKTDAIAAAEQHWWANR